ncbi:MAG: DUF4159 domain-containing protein [Planctomycetota bacterium]
MDVQRIPAWAALLLCCTGLNAADAPPKAADKDGKPPVPAVGGRKMDNDTGEAEETGSVQVANLVYAGVRSSVCFSDHFLRLAETDASFTTSRRFHAVKSSGPELFKFPFVIMTGEGAFSMLEEERANLRKFLEGGGFLLASAGCSSAEWDRSFRVEIAKILPACGLKTLPLTHRIFKTVYEIKAIKGSHGQVRLLEGVEVNGRVAVVYSADGLNDTAHVHGCCCCGGNEIMGCAQINVNILAYALTH